MRHRASSDMMLGVQEKTLEFGANEEDRAKTTRSLAEMASRLNVVARTHACGAWQGRDVGEGTNGMSLLAPVTIRKDL